MSGRNPRVAFGLQAGALALKAKSVRRVQLAEVLALAEAWEKLVPDDLPAGAAVARFMGRVVREPVAAGEGMLVFLAEWWGKAPPRKIPAPPPELKPAPPPDWTQRRDCGLD